MKLDEILKLAFSRYDPGLLSMIWDEERQRERPKADECGDTLGLFVLREIAETYEADAADDEQLSEARRAVCVATEDLGRVEAGIWSRERELLRIEVPF